MSTRLSTASRMRSGSTSATSPAGASTVAGDARLGARAAACSALRVSSGCRSVGSGRGWILSSSLLARNSSCSVIRASRAASSLAWATAAASSSRLRPGRPASSSSPRSTANGVRSSWLASATRARCRASAPVQPAQQLVHRRGQRRDLVPGARAPGRRAPGRARRARRPRGAAARPATARPGPARRRRARRRPRTTGPAISRLRMTSLTRAVEGLQRDGGDGDPAGAWPVSGAAMSRSRSSVVVWVSARSGAGPRLAELGRAEQRRPARRRGCRRAPGRRGR